MAKPGIESAADNSGRARRTEFTSPRTFRVVGTSLLVALSIAVYLPSLRGGFILDDDLLLTNNHLIKAPDGLWRFWYTTQQPDYVPLTSSTLWLEWRLWGTNPVGYRITNLVLHIGACLLLWRLLGQLSIPGGFLAALLFAIHPVNVESVAWVEQRKNTLSLVLFLCSMLAYFRAEKLREASQPKEMSPTQSLLRAEFPYWMSLLAFALAMYSKGSAAVLPLALLLVVWWRRGRLTRSDILRIAPFFLVAAVLTPLIVWFVTHNSEQSVRSATFPERLLQAGAVVWFYLSKALVPIELIFVYPQWNIQIGSMLWWLPLAALVFVTLLLVRCRRLPYGGALLLAWLLFVVALLPVLGFTDPGYMKFSLVADHYQHIALLAVVSLVAAAWTVWHNRVRQPSRWATTSVAVVYTGVLTLLTCQQSCLYGNAITLYEATLQKNPDCWMIHINLGSILSASHTEEAMAHYQAALSLPPKSLDAHVKTGTLRDDTGQEAKALAHFQRALELQPSSAEAHYNLANLLVRMGRLHEALEHYQDALKIEPESPDFHNNLGGALELLGRPNDAINQYQCALRLDPNFAEAQHNLGAALLKAGQTQSAIDYLEQAVHLKPDYAQAYFTLAVAYSQLNRSDRVAANAQKAADLADAQGQTALAQRIEDWLKVYRSQQSNQPRNRLPPPGASSIKD